MVALRNVCKALLVAKHFSDFFPILSISIILYYISTVSFSCLNFQNRCVIRHHYSCIDTKKMTWQSECWSKVSRRKRYNTSFFLLVIKVAQSIVSSSKFEGSHSLKVFTFEKNLRVQFFVQNSRLHNWCLVGNTIQSFGCSFDISIGWNVTDVFLVICKLLHWRGRYSSINHDWATLSDSSFEWE